jgi:predicted RecB family nuclease
MATKITREILEGWLNCKTKGHLKLVGECGTPSDYEAMTTETRRASREVALAKLAARFGVEGWRGKAVAVTTLKQEPPLLVDIDIEDDNLSLRFDGLKRADGPSRLGDHHYVPVLHFHGDKGGKHQKLLLALHGLALAPVQGLRPTVGLIARGPEGKLGKVRLDAKLYRQAEIVLGEIRRVQEGGEPPRLALNQHCHVCEFRQRCRTQAIQADDISLLQGVGEKELQRYNRKGLFTLTQFSCTFRPRKRGKRVKRKGYDHHAALQALAIREKKVHVYGTPDLPRKPVQVFLDAEGSEDGRFVYLLGVIVVEWGKETRHSFWADGPDQEGEIFDAFLDVLAGYDDFCLFHYGSYERKLLKRMRKVVKRKGLVDRTLANAVNILSVVHASVYFPVFSNGLKEVGKYLGCTWADENASGLQSLVWRARWDKERESCWKDKLLAYNGEDCTALKKVTELVQAVGEAAGRRGEGTAAVEEANVAWADNVAAPSGRREWCRAKFALEDFTIINRCAYFDYQRERVFVRTSEAIRVACLPGRGRKKPKPRVNREVEFVAYSCPRCKGNRLTRYSRRMHSKLAYDLKFTSGGIRRQVIRCQAMQYECRDCGRTFLPHRYKRRDKHLHGLKSWSVYQLVVYRISLRHIEVMLEDCFGLRVSSMEVLGIKVLMSRRYRETVRGILARIVAGGLVHIDETEIHLQQGKGYVWVLASMEDVLYLYRPSREAAFLQEMLRGFTGVVVSDFYPGYESLQCKQQVCLVHLIRDMNDDLKGNPYDEEFKAFAGEFGRLLRSIIGTVEKYGLKRRHLHKHKAEIARFFHDLACRVYRSEVAEGYQKRLCKNEDRLFTFLDHDGVPWNNNAAEHAIKAVARFRELYDGQMSEEGLSDFLVLLSVQQTCKYRDISFLKFLLSREEDVGTYCERRQKSSDPLARRGLRPGRRGCGERRGSPGGTGSRPRPGPARRRVGSRRRPATADRAARWCDR